jgi:hypothetical protein
MYSAAYMRCQDAIWAEERAEDERFKNWLQTVKIEVKVIPIEQIPAYALATPTETGNYLRHSATNWDEIRGGLRGYDYEQLKERVMDAIQRAYPTLEITANIESRESREMARGMRSMAAQGISVSVAVAPATPAA